ncbi:hypothetical protein ABZ807_05465 [Micromonospora sp. NPDC047548]|uniref:hypothetical protein n=1 Tax=Micromonospora sp. NPDC047548 TaxID=3155624 RepID=UPI0033F22AB5
MKFWPLTRRPTTPPPARGPAIQRAEQQAAKRRLLDLAHQRQARHLYDGLSR